MCRIIWQCTLTPPQPSTAAMAGILNTPAAEAHPPVTSSVQLRSKLAQSGRRSSGIYWAAQANMTIHAHIEIIFFVPSATASVSARESGRLEIAGAACASVSPCGMNRVSTPSVRLARVSDTKIMTPARTLPSIPAPTPPITNAGPALTQNRVILCASLCEMRPSENSAAVIPAPTG